MRRLGAILCAAVLAAACSDDSASPPTTTGASPDTSAAATSAPNATGTPGPTSTGAPPTTAATTTRPPAATEPIAPALTTPLNLTLRVVARASAPIALVSRAGTKNRYVAERAGRVRVLDSDNNLSGAILDISADTTTDGERGLLGLAFSPDGTKLYVSYTNRRGDTRVDEFAASGDRIDADSRRNVLAVPQPASNHNGGDIHFGPDGLLWLGLGDGGNQGDPSNNGQNIDALLGSMLRVNPAPQGDRPYTIPPDNPFVGREGADEIWMKGVRNPWRFSFDARTGDLWIGDVGGSQREEINWLPAPVRGRGANLQWALREGNARLKGEAPEGSTPPVFDYPRSGSNCTVIGGHVYRGRRIPELAGTYLYIDYCGGKLEGLAPAPTGNTVAARQIVPSVARITNAVSFGADADNELYILSLDGNIYEILPR